jgi:tetratricopeptide (TPR) repeat protein
MICGGMSNFSFIRRPLLISLACAAPFFAGGWLIVTRASGGWEAAGPALLGMGLFIIGAIIVAPSIAAWIAEPAGSLYMPSGHFDHPAPMYGIADALRAKGDHEGAMAYLEQITRDYPQELDAYVKMIDIAVLDLHSLPRAEAVYHRATHALGNDGDKAALTVMYQALTSRYKDPAHPDPVRPLSLPIKSRPVDPAFSPPATPPTHA